MTRYEIQYEDPAVKGSKYYAVVRALSREEAEKRITVQGFIVTCITEFSANGMKIYAKMK